MTTAWVTLTLALVAGTVGAADLLANATRTPRPQRLLRLGRHTDAAARRLLGRWRRSAAADRVAQGCAAAGLPTVELPTLAAGAAAGALGLVVLARATSLLVTAGMALSAAAVARTLVRRRTVRRREELVSQLPELARLLSNAAAAGLALRRGLQLAAREIAEPARSELTKVVEALAIGDPLERALDDLARRLPCREVSVLVTTLVVQQQAGGRTISALRALADALEDRKELRREVRTVMAGAVSSTHLVLAMGPGAVALMELATPGVVGALTGTGPGRAALAVSVALDLIGLAFIRRLTRIDW